ncbi:T9SS type A sorting domain-containing protein [Dyadobacter psychrotolerans]|uniref:T9SS type A sorting domain-containing protein n=1 Tax=Dyadobacter psychrotolerans TaxID=2541721 RepID=A0A4R5DWD5_9BACT|nr:T9SS type A sorting domain-containing protein [Dyadobacter psychrotolerans]TDE16710.1 T9SS type A sorting domain-containing protein [Dyadobacter psychrotolerans]
METHNLNRFNKTSFSFTKIFLLLAPIVFQCQSVYAQLELVPIGSHEFENSAGEPNNSARTTASLSLPFFDDFSTTATKNPDSQFWMQGSGVYVNNTLTTNHPSVNVATFDGLNAAGSPYNFANPLLQNFTDTLTSQPVNLAGKAVKDSVYISFYWLGKGLGERPDSSDYISLEFFDNLGNWTTVWKQQGYILDTIFKQEFIKVSSASYFHEGFQFRFRSYGRNSGSYDMWHLDYVYLNEKRSARDRFIRDIAVRKPLTSYLNGYTSMPLKHYWFNSARATKDSVITDIVNHFNNFNRTSFTFTVKDETTGRLFSTYQSPSVDIQASQVQRKSIAIKPIAQDPALKQIRLRYKFDLLTTDDKNPDVPSLNLRRNDSISVVTTLSDYYSFDDGSAEYGVQINQKLARAAVRYILAKPDTIAGVRLSLVPFNKDISGQSFTVQLYSNKSGKPDQLLAQRSISAKFPTERNGFLEYAFASPIALTDTFYVGWLQINEEPVTFGFDRNSGLGTGKMFYNLGSSWAAETTLNGSIMIRPYLGGTGQDIISGTEPSANENNYFFPNPGRGIINWKNSLNRIDVYSAQGRLIQTVLPGRETQSASLNIPGDGIYLIKASDGKRSFVQKVLIVK